MFPPRHIIILYLITNINAVNPTGSKPVKSNTRTRTRASQKDLQVGSYKGKSWAPELSRCLSSVEMRISSTEDKMKGSIFINDVEYSPETSIFEHTVSSITRGSVMDYKKCFYFLTAGVNRFKSNKEKFFRRCGVTYVEGANQTVLCLPKQPTEPGELHLYLSGNKKISEGVQGSRMVSSLNLLVTLVPESNTPKLDQASDVSAAATGTETPNRTHLELGPSQPYVTPVKRRRIDNEEDKPISDGAYSVQINREDDIVVYIQTDDGKQLITIDMCTNGACTRAIKDVQLIKEDGSRPAIFQVDGTSFIIKDHGTSPRSLVADFGYGIQLVLNPVDLDDVLHFFQRYDI